MFYLLAFLSCFIQYVSLGMERKNSLVMEKFNGYLDFKEFTETSFS